MLYSHAVHAELFNASGTLSGKDADRNDLVGIIISGYFQHLLQLSGVKPTLEDLGQFFLDKNDETGADVMADLVKVLSVCLVNDFTGALAIVSERRSSNYAVLNMLAVLRYQLVLFQGRPFSDIVRTWATPWRSQLESAEIDTNWQAFQGTRSTREPETSSKLALDAFDRFTPSKTVGIWPRIYLSMYKTFLMSLQQHFTVTQL